MANVEKTTKKNKVREARRLLLESLENRQLMAVDTIIYADGLLTLRSDNTPTHVELSQVGSSIRITEGASIREISAPGLSRIHFFGGNANDYFRAFIPTLQQVIAYGNGGDDTLHGSGLHDILEGGDGDDKLYGWGGNDTLRGGNGDDLLDGGGGHDRLYGEAGNDTLRGRVGNDQLWGGLGNDKLYGGDGNDQLHGEAGNDWLYGDLGDDLLSGGAGSDHLYGGAGNDRLYGGEGVDYLFGEDGNDGLFGGVGEADELTGGPGADRFLNTEHLEKRWVTPDRKFWEPAKLSRLENVRATDRIKDAQKEDATILFRNSEGITSNIIGIGHVRFEAGRWTDTEIQAVDEALVDLHNIVNNTCLFETASGQSITFLRVGDQRTVLANGAQLLGWNGNNGREIAFTNVSFGTLQGSDRAELRNTVYHEIGHNWDDPWENSFIADFRGISQWRSGAARGFTESLAGRDDWYYNDDLANFARPVNRRLGGSYSTWNPMEDYATTWETYFSVHFHGTNFGNNVVAAKFANLDRLFTSLRS